MIPRPKLPHLNLPRVLHQLRHRRIENKGLKLLALLLAVLLFVISRQPMSDVRLVGVPLEFRGLAAGMEISGDVTQTVSVRLRGPQNLVRGLMPNQVVVIADLGNKEPGERIVHLAASDVSRPDEIEVLRIEPASIKLRLEPTLSRQIPVELRFMGELAAGYELYSFTTAPSTVEIEGPQSHVNQTHRALTESIQLDGRSASFKAAVDVDIPDHFIRVTTPGPINVSVEIGERRIERSFTALPIEWIDQAAGERLLTPQVDVMLYGPRSALDALRARDIRVELTTANLPATAATAKPQVRLLGGANARIEVRDITPSEVRIKRQ
jgi:YbbR domain-containing protein